MMFFSKNVIPPGIQVLDNRGNKFTWVHTVTNNDAKLFLVCVNRRGQIIRISAEHCAVVK